MGLFGKKKPKIEMRKIELVINRNTLRAEYRCPYCNKLLVEDNPRLIEKPEIDICPECARQFIL